MVYNGEYDGEAIAILGGGPELLGGRRMRHRKAEKARKEALEAEERARDIASSKVQSEEQAAKLIEAETAKYELEAKRNAAKAAAAAAAAAPVEAPAAEAAPGDTSAPSDTSLPAEAAPAVEGEYLGFDFAAHAPLIGISVLAGLLLLSKSKMGRKLFKVR